MNIVWSPEAIEDLANLRGYIDESSLCVARAVVPAILEAVETNLAAHPSLGRPGRVPGTRELVVARAPNIVPYRPRGSTLEILRVFHGARRWPENI